jgi:hypothetical protein
MWKRAANIYIGVCVILGGIFAFGVGMIFWQSYTNERNPVFQTTMTDVECCDDFNAYFTQKFNALGVKKVHCFIFQGHTPPVLLDLSCRQVFRKCGFASNL